MQVTHVSGTRMIYQGTDGVSRGILREGMALGEHMLEHLPWGKSATEGYPKLEAWVRSWTGDESILLEPIDWFEKGLDVKYGLHGDIGFWRTVVNSGIYLWNPATGGC